MFMTGSLQPRFGLPMISRDGSSLEAYKFDVGVWRWLGKMLTSSLLFGTGLFHLLTFNGFNDESNELQFISWYPVTAGQFGLQKG